MYRIKEGLVPREIKGVCFVIDIHDKHFYRNKQVCCVNRIAYEIMKILNKLKEFEIIDITDRLTPLFNERTKPTAEVLNKDVSDYIVSLIQKGWVQNV